MSAFFNGYNEGASMLNEVNKKSFTAFILNKFSIRANKNILNIGRAYNVRVFSRTFRNNGVNYIWCWSCWWKCVEVVKSKGHWLGISCPWLGVSCYYGGLCLRVCFRWTY